MFQKTKKFALLFSSLLFTGLIFAQIPAGYYDNAQGQSGAQLKTTLFNIINTHTAVSYTPGVWNAFNTTDKKANGKVWDIYSDVPGGTPAYEFTFVSDQCGTYSIEGDCYNREHSFPKSWFNDATPMYTELFHIYPTDGKVNGERSNYPYGEVSNPSWTSTNGSKLGPNSTAGYSGIVFEPIDEYKGDLARTYFYMVTCYEDKVTGWNSIILDGSTYPAYVPWTLDLLMRWSQEDPVSQKEIDRNNAIYAIQHNRNPYIDHPEYVAAVWGVETTAPIISNVYTDPSSPLLNEPVMVYATVTDNNGTVANVTLNWGTVSGSLSNSVAMQANGNVYSATIPAQTVSTHIYYSISAVDNDSETTTTSEFTFYISSLDGTIQLPIYEDFENGDLGIFTAYSVLGSQAWYNYSYSGNLMAKISGYESGAYVNEDWLLTPKINFDNYTNEIMSFRTAMNYPDATTTFQVLYSTNYSGSGDPNLATWTDLSGYAAWSTGNYVFTNSGDINLSGIVGTAVTIAFKYTNGSSEAETWELDDFSITGTPVETSLDEVSGMQSISIYPNPTTQWIQLKGNIPEDANILIFNYLGQLKMEETLKNTQNQQLYVGALKPGIYILQINAKDIGSRNLRLIVQ